MSETVSNSITQGVTLTSDPVLITSTGSVSVANADAITAPGTAVSTGWTITNKGTVVASGATFNGVNLAGGGTIANSGSIAGYCNGINVTGGVTTVTNTGTIDSSPTKIVANVPNYKYDGVFLGNGGHVTNDGGRIYGGIAGVDVQGGLGTVDNSGLIDTTTAQGNGVGLENGGTIFNRGSQGIYGDFSGVSVYNGVGVITNSAVISAVGLSGEGIYLGGGGTVTNLDAGTINGTYEGVVGVAAAITVTNSGSIYGYDMGADLQAGGMITNFAGGTIEAKTTGVKLKASGTVVNGGAIIASASNGTAVSFAADVANRLVVDSGGTFAGLVTGGGAGSVLELGTVAQGTTASLTGIGTEITGFDTITFDSGDDWSLSGSFTGFNGDTIQGLATGDTIVMTGVTTVTSSLSAGVLTLTSGSETDTIMLDPLAGGVQVKSAAAGITLTLVPCFAAGTRIATPEGFKTVETLAEGDLVRTLRGDALPVIWKGQRHVDCAHHPAPEEVRPVLIEAGAFGPAMPARDLLLSPDHAVLVQGVLIPIKYLDNGRTVRQLAVDAVTYHHIELPRHSVILAEGLPAESYLDTGDREQLGLGRDYAVAETDRDIQMLRDAMACAPLRIIGPEVDLVRRHLASRVAAGLRGTPAGVRAA